MNIDSEDVYTATRILANAVEALMPRPKAAIFGICARGLSKYVNELELDHGNRWSFPDLQPALDVVQAYATGQAEAADHGALRGRVIASIPHGHDLDPPRSTYVQDALICVDAGLAAASVNAHPKSIWIEYAIEPQLALRQGRDAELIRSRGEEYWARWVTSDPAMATVLRFLRESITEVEGKNTVEVEDYRRLVEGAAVLCPD